MTATGEEVAEEHDFELNQLYTDFAADNLNPLWTQLGDLMPAQPSPRAVPHVWR